MPAPDETPATTASAGQPPGWNWARTHEFAATRLHSPTTNEQLQATIAAARSGESVRCVGSRHSFTGIADGDLLIDLAQLPERFDVSADRTSVTVTGSMIYSRVAQLLHAQGLALANLASLPHITVAGATATATHGSGDRNGNLATSIRSLEIVTATGDVRRVARGDGDFGAAAISLGALGIVVAVELDVEPTYEVVQLVHNDVAWSVVEDQFDDLFSAAYSVSLFTNWRDHAQLWTKRRADAPPIDHTRLHDGTPATAKHHPVPGEPPTACTHQGHQSGPWHERLPHFRAGAVPSTGAEVQSEFFVGRERAAAAIRRMRSIGDELAPILMASEIRTVARDELWLSPQHGRDCVGLHFTWHHNLPAAQRAARLVADTLAPLHPLPHWGKVFDPTQFDLGMLYPRLGDARRVWGEWDPSGIFQNAWMRETIS